jgi:hypothetical protein
MVAPRAPIEALRDAPLATVPRTVVNELVAAYSRQVSVERLIESVYSGSREPEFARTAMSVQLARIRDKLALYGWTVTKGQSGRGNIAFHKLVPLP